MRTIELSGGRRIRKTYRARVAKMPTVDPVDECWNEIVWRFASGAGRVMVYVGRNGALRIEHDSDSAARTAYEQVAALPYIGGLVAVYTRAPYIDDLREAVEETEGTN
jgi:hypothetical protein